MKNYIKWNIVISSMLSLAYAPVKQSPVEKSPVKQSPANQSPVNQSPVNQSPVKNEKENIIGNPFSAMGLSKYSKHSLFKKIVNTNCFQNPLSIQNKLNNVKLNNVTPASEVEYSDDENSTSLNLLKRNNQPAVMDLRPSTFNREMSIIDFSQKDQHIENQKKRKMIKGEDGKWTVTQGKTQPISRNFFSKIFAKQQRKLKQQERAKQQEQQKKNVKELPET
jgi:hypothetical protein